jgi:hypothetical protein
LNGFAFVVKTTNALSLNTTTRFAGEFVRRTVIPSEMTLAEPKVPWSPPLCGSSK